MITNLPTFEDDLVYLAQATGKKRSLAVVKGKQGLTVALGFRTQIPEVVDLSIVERYHLNRPG